MITMFRCFYSCRLDYYLGPDHRSTLKKKTKKQKNFPAADSKQI